MKLMNWNNELWLFHKDEFNQIPDGTRLQTINSDIVVKSDKLDIDHRMGYLAYGLTYKLAEEQGFKDKFLLWTIT